MWLWIEQIFKTFIQSPGQKPNVRKFSSVCLEVRVLNTLICVAIVPQSLHLPRQSHFHHLSEKTFEQRKEMTFDCGPANIRAAVFIAPTLKI